LSWLCTVIYYRLFDSKHELSRWMPLHDLWPIFLGELLIANVALWVIGYPIYRSARARNSVSGAGLCIAGGITNSLIWLLPMLILPAAGFWAALTLLLIGALKGVVIAAAFSVLAGIPWFSARSMLLQSQ